MKIKREMSWWFISRLVVTNGWLGNINESSEGNGLLRCSSSAGAHGRRLTIVHLIFMLYVVYFNYSKPRIKSIIVQVSKTLGVLQMNS